MPQVRKLTPAEVQTIEYKPTGQRKQIEAAYDVMLSEYAANDYGEALLEPEENRLTVRNRLRAAAHRRDLEIVFRRTNGDLIRFQIVAPGNQASSAANPAAVSSDRSLLPKNPVGRPKKSV